MTAIKNIGEVMHLVTHTYTVQTFASAVSLLTNYHFRTIGSRQHTHTLPSEKHRFTLFKPLQAHFFFKVAAFLHSLSFFNCRFALPLSCCRFILIVLLVPLSLSLCIVFGTSNCADVGSEWKIYIFFLIKNTSVAWCPWSLGAPGQLPSCPYG